jgi:hypothetical protein
VVPQVFLLNKRRRSRPAKAPSSLYFDSFGSHSRAKLASVKTLLLGPIISLLPQRWRESHPMFSSIRWPIAGTLSGLIESFLALLAFVYWYSYSVTHWAEDAVYSAINAGARIPPNTEGFAAFALMFLHPVTWLIGWCAVEGTVRFLGAAFTGNALGILPLVLLDKTWVRFTSSVRAERPADTRSRWSSFLPWVRQRVGSLGYPVLPDEVRYSADAIGEVMSISSSRPKSGWEPPRIIRCMDIYYRLDGISEQSGARPVLYMLRRLPAGVPGRTVITYSPDDPFMR